MSLFRRSTSPKPEDEIEYKLGFACENRHGRVLAHSGATIRSVLWDEQICPTCGEKSFPSVTRRVQGSRLVEGIFFDHWIQPWDCVTYEFVRFLDEDTVRLSEETVARLKDFAKRTFLDTDDDESLSYKNGLHDGVSMAAQYVLGEIKEETNATGQRLIAEL